MGLYWNWFYNDVIMKTEKFDWRLFTIIMLYIALAAFNFFFFIRSSIYDLGKDLIAGLVSLVIGTTIVAILSNGSMMKCMIGVFVWAASVFTLNFWFMMDGVVGPDSLMKMLLISLVTAAVVAVIQLISFAIVKLFRPRQQADRKKP